MILNLYSIRNMLAEGIQLVDLPLRVTFYARVSTDHLEQLNSLENQIMYFENYIKSQKKWTFVPGYVDEGISGTSINRRENFLKMIDDAKQGLFNLVLTKEISRFSRNTVDSIQFTQKLLSYGIGVFFLNDNINTFDSDSELRLTIMSSIAQDEVRKLSERIRFGYRRSIEKGVVPGNDNFYGYKKKKGKLEIVSEEAELIKLIFNEYSKGKMGTTKLGNYLFDKYQIVSKTGKPLAGTVIGRIIRNPKYKGFFCAHKETTVDYRSKKRIKFKPNEWIVYRDYKTCPPIVSEELWDTCNEILDNNHLKYKTKTRTDMRYALSGKIKCYHDNSSFIRGSYLNKKNGLKANYWACANYRKYGKNDDKGCVNSIVYHQELLDIFKEFIDIILNARGKIISDLYNMLKENEKNLDYSNKIFELDKRIKEIECAKSELINMRARKEIDLYEFNKERDNYKKELLIIENDKKRYISMNSKKYSKINLNKFYTRIKKIILSDDECIFRIFNSILNSILVERPKKNDSLKVLLHFNLNIKICNKTNLTFNDFLLLFSHNE